MEMRQSSSRPSNCEKPSLAGPGSQQRASINDHELDQLPGIHSLTATSGAIPPSPNLQLDFFLNFFRRRASDKHQPCKSPGADAALARENEALRSELARMRTYVSGVQHSKGSGSRTAAAVVPAPAKKASFLGSVSPSVSRTLSRLNPFRGGGWAKDTASIAMHVVRPKRRRFSIG